MGKFADLILEQRREKRKECREAIALILLNHQFGEESPFHVLPLEMVHMIITFLLDGLPAATLDVKF